MLALTLAAFAGFTTPAFSAPAYTVTDIGALQNGVHSVYAGAVNNNGDMAGSGQTSDFSTHAILFRSGVTTDLGVLPGGGYSEASGLNDADVVVGDGFTAAGGDHALRWDGAHGLQDLGAPSGYTQSAAYAVNSSGLIVGTASNQSGVFVPNVLFTYDTAFHVTPLPSGYTQVMPTAVNASGVVSGNLTDASYNQVPFYYDGAFHIIPVPGGNLGTEAVGVDDAGHVGGYYFGSNNSIIAFIYSAAGGFQSLDTPGQDPNNPTRDLAYGVSANGLVLTDNGVYNIATGAHTQPSVAAPPSPGVKPMYGNSFASGAGGAVNNAGTVIGTFTTVHFFDLSTTLSSVNSHITAI